MRKTDHDAENAHRVARSIADVHDLRRTSLLFDLVEAHGRVKAAETLGVSYGALARAADTGRLSGRMRDALARHLLYGTRSWTRSIGSIGQVLHSAWPRWRKEHGIRPKAKMRSSSSCDKD